MNHLCEDLWIQRTHIPFLTCVNINGESKLESEQAVQDVISQKAMEGRGIYYKLELQRLVDLQLLKVKLQKCNRHCVKCFL